MLYDPKLKVFENPNDVVDYVTRGFLPPKQKYYDALMNKVKNPDIIMDNDPKAGKEVLVPKFENAELIAEILDMVYKNRRRNLIKGLVGGTLFGLGCLALGIANDRKNKARIKGLENANAYYQCLLFPLTDDDDEETEEE